MLCIKIAEAIQEVLTVRAEQLARQTGCSQRKSKLGGAGLVQTLVFGYLANRQATNEELAQTAAILGYPVSPQAIDQRCGEATADCLRAVMEEAVQHALATDELPPSLLQRFTAVCLQDSTTVTLPDALEEHWQGCDTSTGQGGRAALKIQVRWDFAYGGIDGLRLEQGRDNDHRTPLQDQDIEPGSLHLRDLGYFHLDTLQAIDQREAYFLTRLQDSTAVFLDNGERIELGDYLRGVDGNVVDQPVTLGVKHRLSCRLIAVRVPPKVAAKRRRSLRKKARKKGYTPSREKLALCEWNVSVTNAPPKLLSVDEVLVLVRLRWQIELLFKLWKSDGGLGRTRSDRPWRILCEVFAKLLAMLIQHWILIRSCWNQPNRSLRKAAKAVRAFAGSLAAKLRRRASLAATIDLIVQALSRTARLNRRRKHPSAYQLLVNPALCGYKT